MGTNKPQEQFFSTDKHLDSIQSHHVLSPIAKKHEKTTTPSRTNGEYRTLQANLIANHPGSSLKTILFVGASRGVGTSTTSVQYAKSLAETAKYGVLLIEANYKKPKLHQFFKINLSNGSLGLSYNGNKLNLCKIEPSKLFVLPYNENLPGAESIFQSPWFKLMYEKFDYIILDGPTTQDTPDIQSLSGKVDGIILVIESGKTRQYVARQAKKQLFNTGGKLLGVVLNKRKYYIPEFIYKHLYS